MSTLWPSGRVSWPRISSSQSFLSCGEIKTLSISTPVAFTRVKSCAAAFEAAGDDALEAVVGAGVAAVVFELFAAGLVVLPPQAATASRAAHSPPINTFLFI